MTPRKALTTIRIGMGERDSMGRQRGGALFGGGFFLLRRRKPVRRSGSLKGGPHGPALIFIRMWQF